MISFADWLAQQGIDTTNMAPEDVQSWYPAYLKAVPQAGGAFTDPTTGQPTFVNPNNPNARPTPPPTTGGPGDNQGTVLPPAGNTIPPGSIGSLLQPFPEPAPTYQPINLPNLPAFQAPPPYQLPSAADVRNTPGYQFGLDQGEGALQASAAAKGILNTGGTLEDILKFGQNYADQNYQTAVKNSQDVYGLNYLTQYVDPRNYALTGYQNAVNAATQNAQGQNTFDWNSWLQRYNIFRNRQLDTYNELYGLGSLGAGLS